MCPARCTLKGIKLIKDEDGQEIQAQDDGIGSYRANEESLNRPEIRTKNSAKA